MTGHLPTGPRPRSQSCAAGCGAVRGRSLRSLKVREGSAGDEPIGCHPCIHREHPELLTQLRSVIRTGPFSLFPYRGEQGTARWQQCAAPVPLPRNSGEQGNSTTTSSTLTLLIRERDEPEPSGRSAWHAGPPALPERGGDRLHSPMGVVR